MIERIDSSLFDWLTWRNGTILELLGIQSRTYSMVSNKSILKKHAIGWAPAETIPCRPKVGYIATMFLVGDRLFWTHLRNDEFKEVFDNV